MEVILLLKVLIADDEIIERKYLTSMFQKHPDKFQLVGIAQNGHEVIEYAEKLHPDVIIMDINMPCTNGLDASYTIKQMYPETIILLNTAYAEFEFARKAVDYGLDAYLLKPAKEELILETIQNCLSKKNKTKSVPSKHADTIAAEHKSTSQRTIDSIKEYINEHFHENLTLEDLSSLAHFSPSYLSRLFHQITGLTLKTYLTLKRLENAEFLLKNSDMTIHEVAFNCGFQNVSHFNRVFKAHTELSPLEYRRHFS